MLFFCCLIRVRSHASSPEGGGGWGAHRKMTKKDDKDPLPHFQGHTPSTQAALLLQQPPPRCTRKVEGPPTESTWKCSASVFPSSASFCWTLLHPVIASAVTFTVPLGLLITCSHHYLCLQTETSNMAIFMFAEFMFAKWESCFSNSGISTAWKMSSALEASGQWYRPRVSQVLRKV